MGKQLIVKYPLDLTGKSPNNLVLAEPHEIGAGGVRALVPNQGPFYTEDLLVRDLRDGSILAPNRHYVAAHLYTEVVERTGLECCAVIVITDPSVSANISIDYQVVGGEFSSAVYAINDLLLSLQIDERPVMWGEILWLPDAFPPTHHLHDAGDLYGFEYIVEALERVHVAILTGDAASHDEIYRYIDIVEVQLDNQISILRTTVNTHMADVTNPHKVTKAQVGLGAVLNYPLASKVEAEAASINTRYMTPLRVREAVKVLIGNTVEAHMADATNPHKVTKAQVGLGLVENYQIASVAEANAGTLTNRYLTPVLVKSAITTQIGNAFNAHVADYKNPHQTTKAQVGLSAVQNYGIATTAEAQAMLSNAKYMTPALVKQSLDANTPVYDSRYIMVGASRNGSLRVSGGTLQGYVDGVWRVIWPAQWV